MGFAPSKYSAFDIVPTKINCMEKCVKDGRSCSGIMYGDQHKKCVFYSKKNMKNMAKLKDETGDIYTVISAKLKEHNTKMNDLEKKVNTGGDLNYCTKMNTRCAFERVAEESELNKSNYSNKDQFNDNDFVKNASIPLYNCNGIYSTNPFCTKQYDPNEPIQDNSVYADMHYTDCFEIDIIKNKDEKKKFLSELCKDKYGKEYTFNDDIFNINSIRNCDESGTNSGTKKALCKMDFGGIVQPFIRDKIEHFENNQISEEHRYTQTNKETNNANVFKIVIILLLIFIIGYLTYNTFI